jgi:predicted MFS family arabinose efflux permease
MSISVRVTASHIPLAALFFFTVTPRALMLALIPLEVFSRLGDARSVSILFFVASVFGVIGSLSIPKILRRVGADGLFYLAASCAVLSALLLYQSALGWFLSGMVAWVFSAVAFEISMNLYVMARVPRNQLSRFEPVRILFAVVGYALGPWLGVFLAGNIAPYAPFVLTACVAGVAVIFFRLLGLATISAGPASGLSSNPLALVRHFFAQPRIRLAWIITLARTAWWSTFFINAPIYAVGIGMSKNEGGALVSIGVAMVFTVTLWAKLGRRYGFRWLCIGGFTATGLVSLLVPWAAQLGERAPLAGAALLISAAFCAASLDALGHMAFLRAVRPRERETMSGVYGTYRDAAQLLPPAVFALVLTWAPLSAVFAISGVWMLVIAWYCRYLPRSLR